MIPRGVEALKHLDTLGACIIQVNPERVLDGLRIHVTDPSVLRGQLDQAVLGRADVVCAAPAQALKRALDQLPA